jgi:hypothetical protein
MPHAQLRDEGPPTGPTKEMLYTPHQSCDGSMLFAASWCLQDGGGSTALLRHMPPTRRQLCCCCAWPGAADQLGARLEDSVWQHVRV